MVKLNSRTGCEMKKIDLSGWWRFSIEDNKAFSDPHLKDAHWAKMSVPQNWFLSGLEHHGVVWFRHTFHYNATSADVLQTLRFEGVDYFADVYLNGHHLGQHSGYF